MIAYASRSKGRGPLPSPPMPTAIRLARRPVTLVILDGFGCREATPDNAIARARKPHWDALIATCPHTAIDASEFAVGLPRGQMGNSEVGHLNIGAGRVVYQDYTRIDRAIETGEFARNPALTGAVAAARTGSATLHVLGLVSPGGVHSHERQIAAMVDLAAAGGAPRICVHAFLDGRDTPPQSAAPSLAAHRRRVLAASRCAHRLDRRPLLRDGSRRALGAARGGLRPPRRRSRALHRRIRGGGARSRLRPRRKPTNSSAPRRSSLPARAPATIADGDAIVFMNFRADRARQLTRALTDASFAGFARKPHATARDLRLPHELRRRVPGSARRVSPQSVRERLRRLRRLARPHPAPHRRNREVRARHLFLQRRRRGALSRRRPRARAVAQGGDLRSQAGNERLRGHRPAGRGDRLGKVRRHRLQLRQRRHGGPHRKPRSRPSRRSKRWMPASGG